MRRQERKDAFNDNSDEDSGVSLCSVKSKCSESSFHSQGSAATPGPRRAATPSRSRSPRNRELPSGIKLVQEEVRSYDPRAPALQSTKPGRVGPVRSPAKGAQNQDRLRTSDTVHPRHVSLAPAAQASGESPARGESAAAKKKVWMRLKGKGQGKTKGIQKGRSKSKSKGRGKTKTKGEM